ncbi:MAG: hypothetical protein K8S22_09620 [Betaproteobacteria bacterium]|nr:hypothetical protein [Betaproteobacteria bacterium]
MGRWFAPPQPGDIVWCRFPRKGIPVPGPKSRPALVLAVGETLGHPVVRVAYGTSQKTDQLYAGEFAILPALVDAFAESGLSYPTKFDLGTTFELDYNDIWFGVPPHAPYGQIPKLGILHPNLLRRAAAAARAVGKKR